MKRLFVFFLICVVAGAWVFAQESATTGSIVGKVVDEANQEPLPGAHVVVISERGQKRDAYTGADGTFSIPFLTPGNYTVEITLEGFTTYKTSVVVTLGSRVDIGTAALRLEAGGVIEVVSAPTVDVVSTTTGATISEELMKSVPVGRTFADVAYLAPGVVGSGVGGANPSIAGASGLENTYIVDGVNITNTGYGSLGAYSIVFGSLGTGINFDMVKEVQVKSGGFEAEFGEALGGVINVITKSGGNIFTGDVWSYYRPGFLESSRKHLDLTFTPEVYTTETQDLDVGFDAGGKFIEDKLFWFASFSPTWRQSTRIAPEGFPLRELGEVQRTRRIWNYAGKLTYNASSNHIFEISVFGDPGTSDRTLWRGSAFLGNDFDLGSEELKYGGNNGVARWTGVLSDNFLIETQVAFHEDHFYEESFADVDRISDLRGESAQIIGGLGFVGRDQSKNVQFNTKLTLIVPNFIGRHEFKAGLQYQDVTYDHTTDYTGPERCFTMPDGSEYCTVTGNLIRVRPFIPGVLDRFDLRRNRVGQNVVTTTTDYLNWFIQDNWSILPNLTLKLGVRWERQHMKGGGEGAAELTLSNNWSPRVGFVWDFLNDRKGKIYGYYGTFYEKIPNDMAVRSLSVEGFLFAIALAPAGYPAEQWPELFADPNNIVFFLPFVFEPAIFCSTTHGRELVPECLGVDLKAQYSREFVIGIERQIWKNLVIGARFQHRELGRVIEDIQLNRYTDIFINGTADFGNYVVTNVDSRYPGFPDPTRTYNALEITATKRFSDNWQLQASYRYSTLEGVYEGLFNNDNGQSDPNITSKFDFPCLMSYDPALGYTCVDGPLPTERRHLLRVFGSYAFDFGLNVGLGLDVQSGTPLTGYGCLDLYGCNERLLTPRGDLGRTPTLINLDLHFDYAFHVSEGKRLQLIVDIFNILNSQKVTNYDTLLELEFGEYDAFGITNPDYLRATAYQSPFTVRLGAKLSW